MILHAVQKKIGNFLAKVSNGYENIKQYLLLRTFKYITLNEQKPNNTRKKQETKNKTPGLKLYQLFPTVCTSHLDGAKVVRRNLHPNKANLVICRIYRNHP